MLSSALLTCDKSHLFTQVKSRIDFDDGYLDEVQRKPMCREI